jgi:hypothetical protein
MSDAGADAEAARTCPWCAAAVRDDASTCPDCGAAIAQRESIGDLQIPGLTSVDPALVDYDKRPLHLRGPSPSQGAAPALIVGALAGGPIGAVAIGGVAAVAAVEFLGASIEGRTTPLEDVGKPNAITLKAMERIQAGEADAAPQAKPAQPAEPDHAEDDGGMSIWRDLPPPGDPES